MDNKFNKNKTQNLLNILSQQEVLNDLDIENAQKRIYNSILHKMENDNSNSTTESLPRTNKRNIFNNILSLKAYYKFYNFAIFLVVSALSFYGFLSLTGTLNNVAAQKLIENRIVALVGVQPKELTSGTLKTFDSTLQVSEITGTTGSNIKVSDSIEKISDILIDPQTIKYSCDTFENWGDDYNSAEYLTLSTSGYGLPNAITGTIPEMKDLPKVKTFITSCNFPTGNKNITRNSENKIIQYFLNNDKFQIEYFGGKFAIKSNFGATNAGNAYSSINIEASKLQLIYNSGIKIDHVKEINGVKYNVYKINPEKYFASTNPEQPESKLIVNSYELIYVAQTTGNVYLTEQYFNDKLTSYQKTIETKTYTFEEAKNNSTKYDELKASNIEIKEVTFDNTEMEETQNNDIQEFLNNYDVITPNDDGFIVSSYMNLNNIQKQSNSVTDTNNNEYIELISSPDFNPSISAIKEIKSAEIAPILPNSTNTPLGIYSLNKGNAFIDVSIWNVDDSTSLDRILANMFSADMNAESKKLIDEQVKMKFIDDKFANTELSARFVEYEFKISQEGLNNYCGNGEKCQVNEGVSNIVQKKSMLIFNHNNKQYIFSADSLNNIKDLTLRKISQTQINNAGNNFTVLQK